MPECAPIKTHAKNSANKERRNMKKKTCLAIFAITAACIFLSSCSSGNDPKDGFKVLSDASCDFALRIPSDWNISYTDSMLAANDPDDNANVTAYSFDTAEKTGADDYWEQYLENLEALFTVTVNNTEETTLSGVIARHVFYTVDNGKDSFNCEAVICSRDYYSMYIITLTASVDTYESHTEDFKNIISSFSFK